ncbi:MAG: hypothetical protein ACR2JB_09240 [Bryobacteraceae bacterium]
MKKSGRLFIWGIVLVIVALLVAHVFGWKKLTIDNVTLILVGALLVVPLFESVRKIKVGEFEAEIAPKEVSAAVAKASAELAVSPQKGEDDKLNQPSILDLVRRDPQLGLAKLRIDIEQALTSIYRLKHPDQARTRPVGLSRLVRELERAGDLAP